MKEATSHTPTTKSASGARRSGDDYQDLIALEMLIEFLEEPYKYDWIKVEANDAGYLDDVAAQRSEDKKLVAKQVKYSNYSSKETDKWTWDTFLSQETERSKSLLQKWFLTFKQLSESDRIGSIALYSNRKFTEDIELIATNGIISYEDISGEMKRRLIEQLGDESLIRAFFSQFHFNIGLPELELLQEQLLDRFKKLGGSIAGFQNLQIELRSWVRNRNQPSVDGSIFIQHIHKAALWVELRPLEEHFSIPETYIKPEIEFLERFIPTTPISSQCYCIYGSPGAGKSTFLSYLTKELKDRKLPVIRHHYFLSLSDLSANQRIEADRVAEALMSQIKDEYPQAVSSLTSHNGNPKELDNWLRETGQYFKSQGKHFTLILDGLDHIWRDTSSMDDFDKILRLIFPLPDGVVLIFGTQRLQESIFPAIFQRNVAPEAWIELPSLKSNQIQRFLKEVYSINEEQYIGELILDALMSKTNGHPLFLNYALNYIRETGAELTDTEINRIPWIPNPDLEGYYRALFNSISESQREVLYFLAACACPLPKDGILNCISGTQPEKIEAFKGISFLLYQNYQGYSLFHNSLLVFLKKQGDYSSYEKKSLEQAIEWLATVDETNEIYKWAWLWFFQERLGNTKPIMEGVTREWMIDSLVKRRPAAIAEQIMQTSGQLLFAVNKLPESLSVTTLDGNFGAATDPDFESSSRLLYPQLLLFGNKKGFEYICKELIESIDNLKPEVVARLSRYFFFTKNTSFNETILDSLTDRKYPFARKKDDFSNDSIKSIWPLIQAVAFQMIDGLYILERMLKNASEIDRDVEVLKEYVEILVNQVDIETLYKAERQFTVPLYNQIIVKGIVRLALLKGIQIPASINLQPYSSEPLIGVFTYLRELTVYTQTPIDISGEDILNLNWSSASSRRGDIKDFYVTTFLSFLCNELHSFEEFNGERVDELIDDEWQHEIVFHLYEIAIKLSSKIKSGVQLTFNDIYDELALVPAPVQLASRDTYLYFFPFRDAVLELGLFLPSLSKSASFNKPLRIDIGRVSNNRYLYYWDLLSLLNKKHKLYDHCPDWIQILQFGEQEAYSLIEQLPEKEDKYVCLSEYCFLQGDEEKAKEHLINAAKCATGYLWHKDMTLDLVLTSIDLLYQVDPPFAESELIKIIPAIVEITEYTDGDETRHFISEAANIISKHSPRLLYDVYLYLHQKERYYYAEVVLHSLLQNGDFNDPIIRAIASTTHDNDSLLIISKRASTSEQVNTVWNELLAFHGDGIVPHIQSLKHSYTSPSVPASETHVLPEEFPPEKYGEYLSIVQQGGYSLISERITNWLTHWCNLRPLDALDAIINSKSGLSRERASITFFNYYIKYIGVDDKLFTIICEWYRNGNMWGKYWHDVEDSRGYWNIIQSYYSAQVDEFIQRTFGSWRDYNKPSHGVSMMELPRIVEFLLLVGKIDRAKELTKMGVNIVIDLVSPLSLPKILSV